MKEKYIVKIRKYPGTDQVGQETWESPDGQTYCPTGPAVRAWDKDGTLTEETWCNEKGELHRKEKPAIKTYDPETKITIQGYYIDGLLDREGKNLPSAIAKDSDGKLISEQYFVKGPLPREDNGKPAMVFCSPKTGVAYHESVWQMGHCISVIERDKNSGAVTYTGPPTEAHQQEFIAERFCME